jgi:hypothetical protein
MSDAYLKNFNDFWEDRENFADVTETIIENIESVYRENAPDFIYFVTLYNIFHEFLEDISEDVLPNEATGFKSSQIWNKLYNFQRDAALAIINKLATYNGCILADSVGLFDRQSLDSPTIHRLGELYALGATRKQEVIFWQIDIQGRVRSGKIMKYGPDGHRVKDEGGVNWVHSRMMKQGLLPQDWELTQCLFGEHLLNWPEHRDKVVALVESEKSALIGAACFPNYVWLATGGKSQFSPEKMKVLKGRTVILFPDVDGYQEWKERSKTLTFCKVVVSDVLEKNVTAEEREARIDIADWLVKQLKNGYVPPEPTEEYQRLFGPPPKTNLEQLIEDYPFVQKLVDALDLREEA